MTVTQRSSSKRDSRHHQRLPHIHDRSLPQAIRVSRGRCVQSGDALLHLLGRSHTLATSSPHTKHKGSLAMYTGLFGTDCVKRHSTICEMTFRTAILAMRLNRKRLVVVLESELYIYDISNMQMLKTEKTSPNPNGSLSCYFGPLKPTDRLQRYVLFRHRPRTTTSCTHYPQKLHLPRSSRLRMRRPSLTISRPQVARFLYTMLQRWRQ